MIPSPIGLTLDQLDTPALLIDLDHLDHNIAVMSGHLRERGVGWRPHAKAFKTPAIAHRLRQAGAFGVTVAKVSEAEVMAASGIQDILIAHLVVGPPKVARLAALQRQADVKATVDHPAQVAPIAEAARRVGVTVGLLVDVDLGLGRTGVRSIEEAVGLARRVADSENLRFDGLMGYEGHTLAIADRDEKRAAIRRAIGRLFEARDAVEADGLACRIVSAGGSGSYQFTADLPGVTEIQAGGGIFACMYYVDHCRVEGHLPALSVLATVVSRPCAETAILDAGRKSLSDYQVMPTLTDYPSSRVVGLSAEHATVAADPASDLQIGQKVHVIPGYSDFTFVLHDRVLGHRGGRVEACWPLWGRGMLQ
jgi:D-serine deaminase-like pyridoxal phosphate-dependent protein